MSRAKMGMYTSIFSLLNPCVHSSLCNYGIGWSCKSVILTGLMAAMMGITNITMGQDGCNCNKFANFDSCALSVQYYFVNNDMKCYIKTINEMLNKINTKNIGHAIEEFEIVFKKSDGAYSEYLDTVVVNLIDNWFEPSINYLIKNKSSGFYVQFENHYESTIIYGDNPEGEKKKLQKFFFNRIDRSDLDSNEKEGARELVNSLDFSVE